MQTSTDVKGHGAVLPSAFLNISTFLIYCEVTSRHDGQKGKGTCSPAGLEMSVEVGLV